MFKFTPIRFRIPTSEPVHEPPTAGDTGDTQAATSLHSGTFQYVDSSFFDHARRYLSHVSATAIDHRSGQVFLLRREEPVVVVLDSQGAILSEWKDTGILTGHSIKLRQTEKGLVVWVVDMGARCIRLYTQQGRFLSQIGPDVSNIYAAQGGRVGVPEETLSFGKITDVAWDDGTGDLYITDVDKGGPNNRVVLLSPTYALLGVWGSPSLSNSSDNKLKFALPHAISVDQLSRVWVVNSDTSCIQVISTAGDLLAEWSFPGLKLYGIEIVGTPDTPKTATVYVTGNSLSNPTTDGTIMLLLATMDPDDRSNIGSNTPLTAWSVPGMLHNVSVGLPTGAATLQMFLSTLSADGTYPAVTYKQAVPRPRLTKDPSVAPPLWPKRFRAVALMHPFNQGEQLAVAQVWYQENLAMLFEIYQLDGTNVQFLYLQVPETGGAASGSGKRVVEFIKFRDTPWIGPFSTTAVIPTHDWLVKKNSDYRGDLPLLGTQSAWWHEVVDDTAGTANWHWFRKDTAMPWRTMNSVDSNPDHLPILGDYSFINWPTFDPADSLPALEVAIGEVAQRIGKSPQVYTDGKTIPQHLLELSKSISHFSPESLQRNLQVVQTLIPGLTAGSSGLPLPVWPDQFFMTCTMTPVNRATPMSTEVLYDWPNTDQRTRMFNGDQQSVIDATLTGSMTYQIQRFADGRYQCLSPIDLGPPNPAWATSGGAVIVATIKDNQMLSPGLTTRIFTCPMPDNRQFWIWYSDGDTPVVFMETAPPIDEGTSLALADYQCMEKTSLVDMSSFDVPQVCKKGGKA